MVLLPIVARELRITARRGKTYWLRWVAALAGLAVCLWLCLSAGHTQPLNNLGKTLFLQLSVLAFGYCLLLGPFVTADCLSEEKRDGTLGLLFLTDLRSYDVVLGKWVAGSLAGFYGLLAILPALGLPLLMGGVTPGEYGRVSLAVINAILFSLSAGMLMSALSREQIKAILAAVILVLGISGLIPGLVALVVAMFSKEPLTQFPALTLSSPAYTGYLAFDTAYRRSPSDYWVSLAVVHSLCWLFMATTAILVPRVWRESPEEKPTTCRWFWRFGYTRGWRRLFRRRLERNPILALAARQRWPHFLFWCLVILVAINVSWLTFGYRRNTGLYLFHERFAYALVFINRVWITAMACRFMLEARRTGALELLLTTPLPVRTLLRGHWQALRKLFFWPILAIALLHVFYAWGSARVYASPAFGGRQALQLYSLHAGSSLVRFLSDVVALSLVGAWLSLSCRKATRAPILTFSLVIVLPWALSTCFPSLLPLLMTKYLPLRYQGNTIIWTALPAGVWVLKNALFAVWAGYHLRRYFRAAAAQTFGQEHGSTGRWWPFGQRKSPEPPTFGAAVLSDH